MMTGTRGEFRITGKMVLFFLVAFFGVIMAVNGVFLYAALETWPGLDETHPYQQGIHYNDTLAAAERQKALGWRTEVTYDRAGQLSVQLFDRHDQPLQYARIKAQIQRPASGQYDRSVDFAEAKPGIYGASVTLQLPGLWRVDVSVTGLHGETYRAIHEIMVAE